MIHRIVIFTVLILASLSSFAKNDTLRSLHSNDSITGLSKNGKNERTSTHNPKLATWMSAVLPGAGQVYNKRIWKVPIIYAGFASFGFFIYDNHQKYVLYRDAYNDFARSYKAMGNEPPGNLDVIVGNKIGPASVVQENRDYYRRWRDLNIMFASGWYLLNIIDANVDAHFYDFDVSEDLSLHWEPQLIPEYNGTASLGASISLRF